MHSIELCSLPTMSWKTRQQICSSTSMTRELPTRGFGGAATARRTQSRRVTPMAGKRRTTTKSPGRRREESKEATRGREPPSPAGKGAGRPVAWLAYSNSRPSDFSAPCSGRRHELADEFMPEEDPPPFASILLAPEKRAMPTLIWRTGVGCGEENWRMELHDPPTCVEPCVHNTLIYRQTWARTAPAFSGSAKTGHAKGPHLTEPHLKCQRDGASTPSNRCATRGTIAARPTNGR